MNTADRSISLLDIAIRRRFCFVECPPSVTAIRDSKDHHQEITGVDLAKLMESLNARLRKIGVERDRAVGHSHFLISRNGSVPIEELRSRLRHDIVPLIEEYCYANRPQMTSVLGAIISDGLIAEELFKDDERLVAELKKLCEPVA
jgi:5-methylcytosine-specific restriction protein B